MPQNADQNKSDDQPNEQLKADVSPDTHPSKGGFFHNRFVRLMLEGVSVVLTLTTLWFGSLALLMTRHEIDLTFLKPHAQQWFSNAFSGQMADVQELSARWVPDLRVIEVRVKDVKISGEGDAHQNIAQVRGQFKLANKVTGIPILVGLSVEGGALTLQRQVNGEVNIGLGTPGSFEKVGPLLTLGRDSFGRDDRDDKVSLSAPSYSMSDVKSIDIKSADFYIRDQQQELFVHLTGVEGTFRTDNQYYFLEGKGDIVDAEDKAPFKVLLKVSPDGQYVSSLFDVGHMNPINIAPKIGRASVMRNLDAPLDLQARIEIRPQQGLQSLKLRLNIHQGQLKTGTSFKTFVKAVVHADYNADAHMIEFSQFDLESEALNFTGTGQFNNFGAPGLAFFSKPIDYALEATQIRLNPGRKYDNTIYVKKMEAEGKVNLGTRELDITSSHVDFGSFVMKIGAHLMRTPEGDYSKVDVDGRIIGDMSPRQLLDFWPNYFALGARNWVHDSVKAAVLSNFVIKTNMDENDLTSGRVKNDHFFMSFDVKDSDIQYMRKMPWVREAHGRGILRGNQLDFTLDGGRVDDLRINDGVVSIPRLMPIGGDFTIDLNGTGGVSEMLRISNFPPFEFSRKFGIDPKDFGGSGNIHLHVVRPLLEFFDQNRILYAVDGEFNDVTLPVNIGTTHIQKGELKLRADKNEMSISGPVRVGTWPAQLSWNKKFTGSVPAHYTLKGLLTRENLNSFGIGLRRYFGGEVAVSLSGEGDGLALTSALIEADFKNAEVNMGSLWQKQINEDGHIRAQLMLTDREGKRSNTIHLTDIRAEAPDLDIRGSVEFAENFKLLGVDMNTLKIGGLVDASMGAKPDVGGVLAVDLKGAYLSVEPWVQRAFRSPSRAATLPIMLKADMEKLALNTDYVLKDAKLVFSHTGKAVKLARLNGQVDKGDFVAEIVEMRETATRSVHIDVPNAQTALFTLLGLDYITGGTLNIDGVLPAVGEQGGLVAQLILEDFTLTKAPAFTQILSLASLTGLASTLSGSGLAFTKLDLQFSMQNNQLKIRDGRASGAALGITGEGDIDLGKRIVDFDGVLVPAYGVNSVMGKIPVLGGVIVGKKGEGLFALNYAVKGPFAQTQISVNPLSALTPGFLRRVFDVKRDDVNRPALSGIKEDTADKPADADPKN